MVATIEDETNGASNSNTTLPKQTLLKARKLQRNEHETTVMLMTLLLFLTATDSKKHPNKK